MEDIRDIIKAQKKRQEFHEKDKENKAMRKKLETLKEENGQRYQKQDKKTQVKIPTGYLLIKIPEDLKDIRIGKLRTIHADIFGKEPKHDSAHNKQWIANKIKAVLKN